MAHAREIACARRIAYAGWLVVATAIIALLGKPALAHAASIPMSLYINGQIAETETAPIYHGRYLYIPVSVLERHFGFAVKWDGDQRTVSVTANSVEYEADGESAHINKTIQAEAPLWQDGTPYVPTEWLADHAYMKVYVDLLTRTAAVFQKTGRDEVDRRRASTVDTVTARSVEPTPNSSSLNSRVSETRTLDNRKPEFRCTQDEARPLQLMSFRADAVEARIQTDRPTDVRIGDSVDGWQLPTAQVIIDVPSAEATEPFARMLEQWSPGGEVPFRSIRWQPSVERSIDGSEREWTRITIDLSAPASYIVFQDFRTNEIVIRLEERKTWTVVIDPGHGGRDPGAEGASGRYEKYFTLEQALRMAEMLRRHPDIRVVLTRSEDVYVELEERARIANEIGADLFISVHGNHFDRPVSGTETYYSRPDSESLATSLHSLVLEATGFADRGIREAQFKVLEHTQMPAVLLELGFLSNESDERKMYTEQFQERVAEAIATGIIHYLYTNGR